MQIVALKGGLGNQVFQYIFLRYLEETNETNCLADDSWFWIAHKELIKRRNGKPEINYSKTHNGYELEYVFPKIKKPILLSEYFDADTWASIIHKRRGLDLKFKLGKIIRLLFLRSTNLPQLFIDNGLGNLTFVAEHLSINYEKGFKGKKITVPNESFNPKLSLQKEAYFLGTWINSKYFETYKEILIEELAFRPISDEKNKQYEMAIQNCFSIGVHIRRGDYLLNAWDKPAEYYAAYINKIKSQKKDECRFFVFSDDMNWCKDNAKALGLPGGESTIFVEGNFDYKNNYIDIQLMAICKALIVTPKSTFSFIASLLNQVEGFEVINHF